MRKTKLLHIGLNAEKTPASGMSKVFMEHFDCREVPFVYGESDILEMNKAIQYQADVFNPEIVFIQTQTADIVSHETLDKLKKRGAFVMNWFADIRVDFPMWLIDFGKRIDLTGCSNMNYVDDLVGYGVKADYLQAGYDPWIYHPLQPKLCNQDIVFFGNDYGEQFPLSNLRREMIVFLNQTYGEKFKSYGRGYSQSWGDYMNNPIGEASLYCGSDIGINLSHFDYRRCSSNRLYKMLGCATFCLTKHYPEVEKDFIDGEHLVVWSDLSDLKNKIDYYLGHEEERIKIAIAGHNKSMTDFTYWSMAKNIEKLWKENLMQ